MSPHEVIVLQDTTLRDGEQAAGVNFLLDERIRIFRALSDAGVTESEVGTPAMGELAQEEIRALTQLHLKMRTVAWCRMRKDDLDAASRCGTHAVNLSVSASDQQITRKLRRDRRWVLRQCGRLIRRARDLGFDVHLGGEDSSRADLDFLFELLDVAQYAGAKRFRFADTLGVLDPFSTHKAFSVLRTHTDLELEIHAHNDLGMATANSLAAVRGGATHVSVTVNGIGERAGNAPLEEVAAALPLCEARKTTIDACALRPLSRLVANASGRAVTAGKAIVGDAIFTHESGIHVSGLLRDPNNYQHLDPAAFGTRYRIVLGKHSGLCAVQHAFHTMGIVLTDSEANVILQNIREHHRSHKQPLSTQELRQRYATLHSER